MSPVLEAWSLNHWTVCPGKSCMSSLEECLFRTYAYFLIVCVFVCLFVFLILSCVSCICIFWKLIHCQLQHLQIFSLIL